MKCFGMLCGMLAVLLLAAADAPAGRVYSEKDLAPGAAAKDGVFTRAIETPTRYCDIYFNGEVPFDPANKLVFEYRVRAPERLKYVAAAFSPDRMRWTFNGLQPSGEWTTGEVPFAKLHYVGKQDVPKAGVTFRLLRIYGRIDDKNPAAPMKLEVRNVRIEKDEAAERLRTMEQYGLITKEAEILDGVFTRAIEKPTRFCSIHFRRNDPFKPSRRLVFDYRVKDPEKLDYVAAAFSPDGKRWTFDRVKPSGEWTTGIVPFDRFYYTGKMGNPKAGETFKVLHLYGRINDRNSAAPMKLEVRNIRVEDDPAFDPMRNVRRSYSAYPVFYWAEIAGASGYEITVGGQTAMTKDAFFVPDLPLEPGFAEYEVKALPTKRSIVRSRVYIPERNVRWKRPDFDFKSFAALPHPRLKVRLTATLGDREGLIANARRDIGAPIPAEPPAFKPGMSPEIKDWIDWKRVYGGRINAVAARLQRAGKGALLTNDPELLKSARDAALAVAKWDPKGTSGVFTGMRDNDLAGARLLRGLCWCYDAAYDFMTPEERETIAKIIRIRADQFWRAKYPFRGNPANNHSWDNVDAFVFAALTLAEEPGMETRVRYGADLFAYLFFPELGYEGENNEGLEYWSFGLSLAINYVEDMKHTVGLDFYQQPWLRQTARFPMYGMPPFGYPVSFSDNHLQMGQANHTCLGPLDRFFTGNLAANAEDGAALWYAGLPERNGVRASFPLDVPQSRYYAHIGETFFNTFLPDGRENVAVGFHSGFCFRGHQHADQNSFTINAYGDKLAIDGGYYDWFGSPHFKAYSTQTAAHNTVLVDGQGQLWGKAGADGATTAYFDAPGFGFVSGDARKAYAGALKRFDRELLFVKPGFVFVFDRLAADKPVKFDWLIHSHTDGPIPYRDGEFTIRRPKAELAGKMLLPKTAAGKCAKSTDVAPALYYSTSPAPRFEPEWTLSLSPEAKTAATEFLAVMRIGRPGAEPVRWQMTDTADAVLVSGGGVEVLFNRKPGTVVRLGEFATDARCAAAVRRGDTVFDVLKIGGRLFSYQGKSYGAAREYFALRESDRSETAAKITLDGKALPAKLHRIDQPYGSVYALEGLIDFPADAQVAVRSAKRAHLLLAGERRHWGDELFAGEALTVPVTKGKMLFCISVDAEPGEVALETRKTAPAAAKVRPADWCLPDSAVKIEAEQSVCESRPRISFLKKPGASGCITGSWSVSGRSGEWHVDVPEKGRYRLYLRYSAFAACGVFCRVDDRPAGSASGLLLAGTGGIDSLRWAAAPEPAELSAGRHIFRLISATGSVYFDRFALVRE